MKKQYVVALFMLAVLPIIWIAVAANSYPAAPFGGGGGAVFNAPQSSHAVCGAWCGAIVAWLVEKALDYTAERYAAGAGNAAGVNGAVGGGGGDAFGSGGVSGSW